MNNRELTVGYAQIYTGCAACDDVIEPGERAYRVDESAKLYCSKTCAASVVPDRIRLSGISFDYFDGATTSAQTLTPCANCVTCAALRSEVAALREAAAATRRVAAASSVTIGRICNVLDTLRATFGHNALVSEILTGIEAIAKSSEES